MFLNVLKKRLKEIVLDELASKTLATTFSATKT